MSRTNGNGQVKLRVLMSEGLTGPRVRTEELIVVEHCVGAGEEGDPSRIVVSCYRKDGTLVAWCDKWLEDEIVERDNDPLAESDRRAQAPIKGKE